MQSLEGEITKMRGGGGGLETEMGLQCTHLHKCFLNHSFSHTVVFQKFMGSTYRCFKETVTLISTKGGGGPLPFYLRPADNVTKWDLRHALTLYVVRPSPVLPSGKMS